LAGGILSITQHAVDPEGGELSYSWEKNSGCGLIISGKTSPTVNVDLCLNYGRYMAVSLKLTVFDSVGNSDYKIYNFE